MLRPYLHTFRVKIFSANSSIMKTNCDGICKPPLLTIVNADADDTGLNFIAQ